MSHARGSTPAGVSEVPAGRRAPPRPRTPLRPAAHSVRGWPNDTRRAAVPQAGPHRSPLLQVTPGQHGGDPPAAREVLWSPERLRSAERVDFPGVQPAHAGCPDAPRSGTWRRRPLPRDAGRYASRGRFRTRRRDARSVSRAVIDYPGTRLPCTGAPTTSIRPHSYVQLPDMFARKCTLYNHFEKLFDLACDVSSFDTV